MKINPFNDTFFMNEALKEARKALDLGEVPVGAVIVSSSQIIARAHNYTQQLNDATAHAEMQAYTIASDYLQSRYLHNCTLYVTLEPCMMCAGAAYWTQISKIVYGTKDDKKGFSNLETSIIHPKTIVQNGLLEYECKKLLKEFFKNRR
tara:strand:+ start:666 stop:1112 length:447 start_codon:yes stop_codon:yes gene_type:complete